jgi:uncharacterized DUF497 family protein
MNFEWDEANRSNREKHGFDFAFAALIFDGPVRQFVDPRPRGTRDVTVVYTRRGNRYRNHLGPPGAVA